MNKTPKIDDGLISFQVVFVNPVAITRTLKFSPFQNRNSSISITNPIIRKHSVKILTTRFCPQGHKIQAQHTKIICKKYVKVFWSTKSRAHCIFNLQISTERSIVKGDIYVVITINAMFAAAVSLHCKPVPCKAILPCNDPVKIAGY